MSHYATSTITLIMHWRNSCVVWSWTDTSKLQCAECKQKQCQEMQQKKYKRKRNAPKSPASMVKVRVHYIQFMQNNRKTTVVRLEVMVMEQNDDVYKQKLLYVMDG